MWYARLQTFGALCQNGAKWRRKYRILRTLLSPKQRIVSPIFRRAISVQFPCSVVMKLAEQNFKFFPKAVIFAKKNSF